MHENKAAARRYFFVDNGIHIVTIERQRGTLEHHTWQCHRMILTCNILDVHHLNGDLDRHIRRSRLTRCQMITYRTQKPNKLRAGLCHHAALRDLRPSLRSEKSTMGGFLVLRGQRTKMGGGSSFLWLRESRVRDMSLFLPRGCLSSSRRLGRRTRHLRRTSIFEELPHLRRFRRTPPSSKKTSHFRSSPTKMTIFDRIFAPKIEVLRSSHSTNEYGGFLRSADPKIEDREFFVLPALMIENGRSSIFGAEERNTHHLRSSDRRLGRRIPIFEELPSPKNSLFSKKTP